MISSGVGELLFLNVYSDNRFLTDAKLADRAAPANDRIPISAFEVESKICVKVRSEWAEI